MTRSDSLIPRGGEWKITAQMLAMIRMAAAGYSGNEIAKAQCVARSTVNIYMSRLYTALGVRSQSAAVAVAILEGYITKEHILQYREEKERRGGA